jgi:DnaJ-class molecular chaperone
MSARDNYYLYGNLERDPKTKLCSYCRGTGYRLVSRHIEVECTRCKGRGYVMTRVIKPKNPKDPQL